MADDWMDSAAVMATNPYMSLPQPRGKWAVLGNLLMGAGAGAGISQADVSSRGWASGIVAGLMTGMQMAARRAIGEKDRFGKGFVMPADKVTGDQAALMKNATEANLNMAMPLLQRALIGVPASAAPDRRGAR